VNCGEEISIKDVFGTYVVRFIAQCEGRFFVIAPGSHLNGYLLMDWRGVLRELIVKTVPAKLIEKRHDVQSSANGLYHCVPLNYPLSAKGLAGVLGVPVDDVRAELADLAVETE